MTSDEIQAIFFLECEEALAAAETALDACRAGSYDADTINAIFRAVHSIKGGAGAFGFTALQHYTHGFETLLSDVRDETVTLGPELVELMLRALDVLNDHVASARGNDGPPDDAALLKQLAAAQSGSAPEHPTEGVTHAASTPVPAVGDVADLDFDLDAMLGDIAAEVAPEHGGRSAHIRPLDAAMQNGGEPVLLLRELVRLGAICTAVDCAAVPALEQYRSAAACLAWTYSLPGTVSDDAVMEIFDFFGDDFVITIASGEAQQHAEQSSESTVSMAASLAAIDAAIAGPEVAVPAVATTPSVPETKSAPVPAAAAAAPAAGGQSIRIDLIKLDRLIDAVGELVIAQAMMAQRLSGHGLAGIEELAMLDGLTRDIQENAMGIRAQPIGSVFSRVPRMLRELEGTTGKRVTLEVSGEATELDKTVIERLGEPLTHLIRNAVDHGIEPPADRVAAGKPPQGTLRLSAEHRSGRIVIRVSDDGKGIDRERVLAKAVERGLVSADAALSSEEIDNLIFAPGFSTAQTVSNISGRGVGMDVVRQNVKDLGGRISIESTPGVGSVFTLALPLTLAISDGMIVTVGDQTLVVPLAHVVESLRPEPGDVKRLGTDRAMLDVRGKFVPILPLDRAVNANGAVADPCQSVLIVVDTEVAGKAALQVDAICDQRQFVIKSLDTHYRPVDGVAGATILGDGRVALIVDVDALVSNAVTSPLRAAA